MKLLLYSGLLYLFGISIILIYRPYLMFTENGIWKEFGIGRNSEQYTWMPFWLFAIIWAIVAYCIVLILAGYNVLPGVSSITKNNLNNNTNDTNDMNDTYNNITINKHISQSKNELKKGYYILNKEDTAKKGIPKYIFIGKELPNVVYNNN